MYTAARVAARIARLRRFEKLQQIGNYFVAGSTAAVGAAGAYLSRLYKMPGNKRKAANGSKNQSFFKGRYQGPNFKPAPGVGGEDVQYIAAIRNTRSKYGKRRRKNLRNAWHEINKDKVLIWSRFQAFRNNGFAEALGPFNNMFVNTGSYVAMPIYAFRLTSFPTSEQSTVSGFAGPVSPLCMFQLTRTPFGNSNPVYSWSPVNAALAAAETGTSNQINTWDVYRATGDGSQGMKILHGFRHEWTNIKLTFYPQQGLPTDWTVRLVKFKDEIPGYPNSVGRKPDDSTQLVYSAPNPASGQRASAVTMMWDEYFGGKILHPHNTQPVSKTDFGKLPFVPLRTEKFYVPAREQTIEDAPTRVLHKMFFRNDRHYNTRSHADLRADNPSTVGFYEYIDENKQFGDNAEASPFVAPGEEIWLMVEATGYKTSGTAPPPLSTLYPSFDICMRNLHSYQEADQYGELTQYNRPALAGLIDEETKETEKAVNEETENAVNEETVVV